MKIVRDVKGITLVALVVTIIVLLILAGVSLSLVAGSDGILSKAGKAVNQNRVANAKEMAELYIMEVQADYYDEVYAEGELIEDKFDYVLGKIKEGKIVGDYFVGTNVERKIVVYGGSDYKGEVLASGVLEETGKMRWDDEPEGGTPVIENDVSYDANGGEGTLPEVIRNVQEGTEVMVDATGTLTREGYVFLGWARKSDTTEIITSFMMPAEDVTLYAVWKLNAYAVNYDANGGEGTLPSNVSSVQAGTTFQVDTTATLTKTGYTFLGWAQSRQATEKITSFTMPQEAVTLYAVWKINTYTVSYDANGGTGNVPATQTQNYQTTVTVSFSPLPTKTGYSFAGWNTKADGTGTNYTQSGTKTFTLYTNSITLYAKWTINQYTITYNANGGSVSPASTKLNYGAAMSMPTPTRAGYVFTGWFTAASGGTKRAYTTMPAANETVYAQWKDVEPLYLYQNGTINSAAGDFVKAEGDGEYSAGTFSKSSNYLFLERVTSSNQWRATGFLTKNSIDVTQYKTLTFTYKTTSYMTSTNSATYTSSSWLYMGLSSYSSSTCNAACQFINGTNKAIATSSEPNSTTYLDSSYSIDISSVTGKWYIGVQDLGAMWRGQSWHIYCTSIYLH